MRRLLVSVRGPVEALAAAKGGAHIADVEHPSSALGTPYPLNIRAVREQLDAGGYSEVPISTNIGEEQRIRSSACQAALGVAVAGANYVKCGFAGLDPKAAACLTTRGDDRFGNIESTIVAEVVNTTPKPRVL